MHFRCQHRGWQGATRLIQSLAAGTILARASPSRNDKSDGREAMGFDVKVRERILRPEARLAIPTP
jgi:hypothetical protein